MALQSPNERLVPASNAVAKEEGKPSKQALSNLLQCKSLPCWISNLSFPTVHWEFHRKLVKSLNCQFEMVQGDVTRWKGRQRDPVRIRSPVKTTWRRPTVLGPCEE